MYLELYNSDATDFTQPGVALTDAYSIFISRRINNAGALRFKMPRTSPQWHDIKRESVVKVENQLYVVKIIADGSENGRPYGNVEAKHIWWEVCEKKHLPKVFFIGTSANEILRNVFSGISYKSNNIKILSDSEIYGLGMEPVSANTDIDVGKANPLAITSHVINAVGGEIYVDNFSFALVKQIGKERNIKFSLDKNTKGIDRTDDTTQLVTRLYPYGKDGMEVSSVNGGVDYIDSPLINSYEKIYSGFLDFRDIERPDILLQRAWREFSEDNYHRIDIPKLSYRCSVVDLWKLAEFGESERFELGDYVQVYDARLGIDSKVRVVEYNYYPYEPQSGSVVLGNPPKTVLDILSGLSGIGDYYYKPEPEAIVNIDETIVNNIEFIHTITEVIKQEVVAADVIHATNAFIEDMFVERLITNIMTFKCVPNLVLNESGACEWRDMDENEDVKKTFSCTEHSEFGDIRPYIKMETIYMEFIEAHLVEAEDLTSLTLEQVEPLVINGRQIYYTSILGGQAPYQWLTFASPESKYPDISSENAEMFKVYIRKAEAEHIKAAFNFNLAEIDGMRTFIPELRFGVGDGAGRGVMHLRKEFDGAELTYVSQDTGVEMGFKILDDAVYFYSTKLNEWIKLDDLCELLPGDGGDSEHQSKHVLLDHLPTTEDIGAAEQDDVILVYDPNDAYVAEDGASVVNGNVFRPVTHIFVASAGKANFQVAIQTSANMSFGFFKHSSEENNPPWDFTVDWGDGTQSVMGPENTFVEKMYETAGEWIVSIRNYVSGHISFMDKFPLRKILTPFPEQVGRKNFSGLLSNCQNLIEICDGFLANQQDAVNFDQCFSSCSSLQAVPKRMFENCSNAEIFSHCFQGCTSLVSVGENAFKGCVSAKNFMRCFNSCRQLRSLPGLLFADCVSAETYEWCFSSNLQLDNLPEDMFKNCVNVLSFSGCFRDNERLSGIPAQLFADAHSAVDFSSCFQMDMNLSGLAPAIWLLNGNDPWSIPYWDQQINGSGCFDFCNGLENYNQIPVTWGGGLTTPN